MDDYPIYNYPTGAETDPNILYRSLGTFWTQIFQEKDTIRGYTLAVAEEMIQRYYDLLETIDSYSSSDVSIFHREKWKPIIMLKSKFNTTPYVFEQGKATFGSQSQSRDSYYTGATFQFGYPKRPTTDVFLYPVGTEICNFGCISDKIFNPSKVYVKGTDVILKDGELYFNTNIFEDSSLPKMTVMGENGVTATYIDKNGVKQDEQMLILWMYNASLDQNILYNNFGYIFNLNRTNDHFFKALLKDVFKLYVNGPTVRNTLSICASFLGIQTVVEKQEKVEQIFADASYRYVITDKHTYKFDLHYNLLPTVQVDTTVYAGDALVEAINYYDNLQTPDSIYPSGSWWSQGIVLKKKLALSQYLFLGNYKQQLVFSNDVELATIDSDGKVHFPVEGNTDDLKTFFEYINQTSNQLALKKAIWPDGDYTSPKVINPVDFILTHFLRTNTVMLSFKFYTQDIQSKFLDLLPILREELPPYLYIIFGLDLVLPTEVYDLDQTIVLDVDNETVLLQPLNPDASNSAGYIERTSTVDGYTQTSRRLFVLSKTILAGQDKYEYVCAKGYDVHTVGGIDCPGGLLAHITTAKTTEEGRFVQYMSGAPMRNPIAGETTSTFRNLLLLDFS